MSQTSLFPASNMGGWGPDHLISWYCVQHHQGTNVLYFLSSSPTGSAAQNNNPKLIIKMQYCSTYCKWMLFYLFVMAACLIRLAVRLAKVIVGLFLVPAVDHGWPRRVAAGAFPHVLSDVRRADLIPVWNDDYFITSCGLNVFSRVHATYCPLCRSVRR